MSALGLEAFRLNGRNAVILGATGILGGAVARGLGRAGARVAICGRKKDVANRICEDLAAEDIQAQAFILDALNRQSLEKGCQSILDQLGSIDILVNAVGGNVPQATISPDCSLFDLSEEALQQVMQINLFGGGILPAQVFGKSMAQNPSGGSMILFSSMSAFRPLTRIIGYSAAKAAVNSLTQWLAVHFAQEYTPRLRVNAIAPGFFLTEQNRFLLTDGDRLTPRGESIIAHTPAGRFGEPEELVGAAIWLASDASRFVTGAVIPVDGGFSAFSGV